jgi:predicted amidophosphoribosyltransferase
MAAKKPPDQISRQRRWQLKKRAATLCPHCGKPAAKNRAYCPTALETYRVRDAERRQRAREQTPSRRKRSA